MKINIPLSKLTKGEKSESKIIKFMMTGKAEPYNRQSRIQGILKNLLFKKNLYKNEKSKGN